MADPLSRLAARLAPRVVPRVQRLRKRVEHQLAPAARLARVDLNLARTWASHADALRRELGPSTARAYTELVLQVAQADARLARVVAHGLPDRLVRVDAPRRRRYQRLLRAVARDRVQALPLVMRTLPELMERLDEASLARYLARGLELHAESARKAQSFLRMESGEGQREVDRLQRGLALEGLQRTLALYARAHCGREVRILPTVGAGPRAAFSDGRHIHLPPVVDIFGDERDRLVYRVLTARAAGFLEFGSMDLDLQGIDAPFDWPERRPGELEMERLLRAFPNPSLARDLLRIFEGQRVETRVRAAYPGIARDMDRLDGAWRPERPDPSTLAPAELAVEQLARAALDLPELDDLPPPVQRAARHAARQLHRVRAPQATVGTAVACVLDSYGPYDDLLRRVDPEELERLDEDAGAGDSGGPGSGARDPEPAQDDDAPARTGAGSSWWSSSDEADAHDESSDPADYQAFDAGALGAELRTEAMESADRALEERALELLEALREADADAAEDLSELRERLAAEERSYAQMADFLQRTGGGPTGPAAEERSPTPSTDRPPDAASHSDRTLRRDATDTGRQHLHPEWDSAIGDHKPDWVRVTEYLIEPGTSDFVRRVREEHGPMIHQLRRAFEALRPQGLRRERGVPDGDEIDLDRAIQARIERRAGGSPDPRIYRRRRRLERDVAVAFLVDMSSSTNEVVGADSKRVIDVEKEALVLIAEAVDAIGDACAIWGWSGYGRDQVAFYIAKEFSDPWDDRVRERIGGMSWKMENRDGAAIRHATKKLSEVRSRVKLLLLLSDGKPLDCGCDHYADRYAQDDTRRALQEARALGVHPFCITVDPGGSDYLADLYGETGYTVIDRVESLPRRLPLIYRRLTR